MIKRLIPLWIALGCSATLCAEELKSFKIDCDAWSEGDPPKEVFVVDGTIKVAAKDGNKALMVDFHPIADASAQLGESANGSAAIQAKVFGSKRARSYPRFGVSVHGMSGYRLMVNAAQKELELVKNEEKVASVPFAWTTDTWVQIKLEVAKKGDKEWEISGKAWADGTAEPSEPMIMHQDATLKGQGKCAVWGSPYSEMPIYFDDIKIQVAAAPAS